MIHKIYVCIKQVPDTSEVRIDPKRHTLIRTGVESIINPYDLHAMEAAVTLKESWKATVTAICMGPPQAEKSLREALARGADHAVLLSDKFFSGADTWCTALTLNQGIRLLGIPDIIFCGKQAIDGDTAQVGPELAELLSLPQLLFTNKIDSIDDDSITITQLTDNGTETLSSKLPALISVVKSINIPRLPSLHNWIYAKKQPIKKLDTQTLKISPNLIGLKGSPTRVKKIEGKIYNKQTVWLPQNPDEAAREILNIINNSRIPAAKPDNSKHLLPVKAVAGNIAPNLIVIGELQGDRINSATKELAGIAYTLSCKKPLETTVILPAAKVSTQLIEEAKTLLVDNVIFTIHEKLTNKDVYIHTQLLINMFKDLSPEIVLGSATLWGRSLLPRLAAALKTGLTADCTSLSFDPKTGLLLQKRPAFGGNVEATIFCPEHKPQMATVRPHAIPLPQVKNSKIPEITIKQVDLSKITSPITFLSSQSTIQNQKPMRDADIIISGGRGVSGTTNFSLLGELAHIVSGSVGASRSAVDAGWAPYENQIGQTGTTVQPAIYIAIGISGAIQHLVGMQSSKTIIAINPNKDAPIFTVADFGYVGDFAPIINSLIVLGKEKYDGR